MEQESRQCRSRKTLVITFTVVLFMLVALLGLHGTYTEIWDGSYPRVACEFTFTDASGKPIEGVMLQVERASGAIRHHWPIDDFYPGHIPTSNQDGVLQFHCCGHPFGGTCHTYFHFIRVGDCGAPEYNCRFFYGSDEIHRVAFNELAVREDWSRLPKIKWLLAIPTIDQIFDGSIPPASELPKTEYEFMLVQRTVIVDL